MNPYTHFYLYAKGWYKKSSNIMNDLKILTGEFSGVPVEFVHERDVFQILSDVAWKEISRIKNSGEAFKKFIGKMENDGWEIACLNVLMMAQVDLSEIGRPDDNLLPYANEITDSLIDAGGYCWSK